MPDREQALDQLISDIAMDLIKLETLYRDKKKQGTTSSDYADGIMYTCKRVKGFIKKRPKEN